MPVGADLLVQGWAMKRSRVTTPKPKKPTKSKKPATAKKPAKTKEPAIDFGPLTTYLKRIPAIESTMGTGSGAPGLCAQWLEGRLPRPVEDAAEWNTDWEPGGEG